MTLCVLDSQQYNITSLLSDVHVLIGRYTLYT